MRITSFIPSGMSNEGQEVTLPDGRHFVFVWQGLISLVSKGLVTRSLNPNKPRTDGKKNLGCDLFCRQCRKPLREGMPYYNRKASNANRKSRFYDIECAQTLGYIEQVVHVHTEKEAKS